jgi:hypothetical protein
MKMRKVPIITFDEKDLLLATSVAIRRNSSNIKNRVRTEHNTNLRKTSWQGHCIGALGELAVCFYFGVEFKTEIGNFNDLDVANAYEVRTGWRKDSHLAMFPEDFDNVPFIHVRGSLDKFGIMGWLWGKEAKQQRWWRDKWRNGRTNYYIHEDNLRCIKTIPSIEIVQYKIEVEGRNGEKGSGYNINDFPIEEIEFPV